MCPTPIPITRIFTFYICVPTSHPGYWDVSAMPDTQFHDSEPREYHVMMRVTSDFQLNFLSPVRSLRPLPLVCGVRATLSGCPTEPDMCIAHVSRYTCAFPLRNALRMFSFLPLPLFPIVFFPHHLFSHIFRCREIDRRFNLFSAIRAFSLSLFVFPVFFSLLPHHNLPLQVFS